MSASLSGINRIRWELLDPSTEAQKARRRAADEFSTVKLISLGVGVAGAAVGAMGWFTSGSHPIIGGMVFVAGVIVTLAAREVFTVSSNAESMFGGSLIGRASNVITADVLVNQALEGSWIIKPLAGNFFKRKLEEN